MNNQQAFDHICDHLMTQRKQAMIHESCVYRDGNGLKCAVGCLIPDEIYIPEMESMQIARVCAVCPEIKDVSWQLLIDCQSVHDRCFDVGLWATELRKVATKHRLDQPTCIKEAA